MMARLLICALVVSMEACLFSVEEPTQWYCSTGEPDCPEGTRCTSGVCVEEPEVLDPKGIAIATSSSTKGPAVVAFDGTNYLVVWQQRGTTATDILAARVSTAGKVLDAKPLVVRQSQHEKRNPALAFDGANYMVVWEDYRWGDWDIYGTRVSTAGKVLDPSSIQVAKAGKNQLTPALAYGAGNYLVVWSDERFAAHGDVYFNIMDRTGRSANIVPVDPTTKSAQRNPAVAHDGANYLVVWEDNRNGVTTDIYGSRVNNNGGPIEGGIAISTSVNYQKAPSVATNGASFLVVWQDNFQGGYDIRGARVSAAGKVLDATSIPFSTASRDQHTPVIVAGAGGYLVAWSDQRNDNATGDIFGTRVLSNKAVDSEGIPLSVVKGDQTSPAVARGKDGYLVVWTDQRGGPGDIYGARLDPKLP